MCFFDKSIKTNTTADIKQEKIKFTVLSSEKVKIDRPPLEKEDIALKPGETVEIILSSPISMAEGHSGGVDPAFLRFFDNQIECQIKYLL